MGTRPPTRRVTNATTMNTPAASNTIVPPGARSQMRDAARPATTDATPMATAHRIVPANERASSCPLATGSTIIAAINRMPTICIAATTATAVITASTLLTSPTGRPATFDQSSSVTTAKSTRRSTSIATTMAAPSATISTTSCALTVSGWPNR